MGLLIDDKTLSLSYRCNPEICTFIQQQLGIIIGSHRVGGSKIIRIEDPTRALEVFNDSNIVKLFYQTHYRYNCFSKKIILEL